MQIDEAVTANLDKTGAVYTDDISKATGYTKEKIGLWLRRNGFHKPCGATSRRWVKSERGDINYPIQ
jgi:hypothetical protein